MDPVTTESMYSSGASSVDILDHIGDEVLAEHSPAAGATDDAGASGGAADTTAAAGATEIPKPEWFESAPQEYKELFGQANVSAAHKKWLETTYGELSGLKGTPYGSPESLTELTELFPGGLDDIKAAHESAQRFNTEMEQFRSGDPGQQTELLSGLIQDNPDSFVSMLHAGADLLKATLRDDYTSFATEMAHSHLETISDGRFSSFFDTVTQTAQKYSQLVDSGNAEEAAKVAAKLGGFALQMSDWWAGAKNKLGYGEGAAKPGAAATSGRPPVVSAGNTKQDDREIALATRESNLWASNYMLQHDQAINPMISQAIKADLAARKMELPENWRSRVVEFVSNRIKQNLDSDKTYLALENRVYRRGDMKDARKWDNSPLAAKTLLGAAKQRAGKVINGYVKQALDDLSTLRGTPKTTTQAGAGNRSAGAAAGGGAGGNANANWEADLKQGKISSLDAIQRLAGV